MLLACALALKLLIPAGYMPVPGQVAVQLCTGQGVTTILLGSDGQPVAPSGHDGTPAPACAYTGLGAPVLSAVDPLLLALAIAIIIALGWTSSPYPPHLQRIAPRPPGRAPPIPVLT